MNIVHPYYDYYYTLCVCVGGGGAGVITRGTHHLHFPSLCEFCPTLFVRTQNKWPFLLQRWGSPDQQQRSHKSGKWSKIRGRGNITRTFPNNCITPPINLSSIRLDLWFWRRRHGQTQSLGSQCILRDQPDNYEGSTGNNKKKKDCTMLWSSTSLCY